MYINFENALKNNHNFFQGMKKAKIMYVDFENVLKNNHIFFQRIKKA